MGSDRCGQAIELDRVLIRWACLLETLYSLWQHNSESKSVGKRLSLEQKNGTTFANNQLTISHVESSSSTSSSSQNLPPAFLKLAVNFFLFFVIFVIIICSLIFSGISSNQIKLAAAASDDEHVKKGFGLFLYIFQTQLFERGNKLIHNFTH